ncbi:MULTISPECIES: phosphomannomutase/phosphoglucomutase [unclassified Oleiphilus]|jgi:phosphomannomutase/phosphoglucomutase|uniref:phosphomannomutase/phosphoglucomutase n=3 Tax=Oleiphilus TaxID=141450 RepID=UPI0009ECD0FA|nr:MULTISPECIES: phosphomannomutase/phosphoglucomutase [unclassified Oleiphilus]
MFKKKDTVVKDSTKEEAAAKKPAKKVKSSKKTKVGKSLVSWIYQPALLVLIGLTVSYFLIDQFSLRQNEIAFNAEVDQQRLDSLAQSFNAYIDAKKRSVANISLQDSGEEGLSSRQLKSFWAELDAVYQVPSSKLESLRQNNPALSFASIDLLRRSLKKESLLIEPFFNEGVWYIQFASPVKQRESQALSGDIMLAIFQLNIIESTLKQSEAASAGEVALASQSGRAILSFGKGNSANKLKSATSVPGVTITYAPDARKSLQIDRIMVMIILLGVGVVLILGLVLIARMNMLSVRKDILQVSQMAAGLASGGKTGRASFSFGEFTAMSSAVSEHIKHLSASAKKSVQQTANKPKEEQSKKTAPVSNDVEDDAPLFDDDLLDLDVLNDAEGSGALGDTDDMVSEVQGLDIDIPQTIFRAYDIRGVVDETLNEGLVELIGKAIASEALLQGQNAICVGFDGRYSSVPYSDSLIRGILSTGLDVVNVGQVPTPVLYFSTHHFKTGSGVMITGSHNPANYNGLKIMLDGKTLAGDDIQKLYNRILLQDFEHGEGSCTDSDVTQEYMDTILNDIAVAAPLKVVLDAGNGVGGKVAPQLIEELGCEVIPLHCEVDGSFPNHHPDPSNPDNLRDLIAAVQEHDADIGLAFDGDADRLGVVTNTGKIIWPDRLLMLFAKDVVSRNPGADILFDVKCSRRLNGLISSYGGRPVMWKSGHSYMKAKMRETGALLAGEMSGHVFFKERWFGFDDGLYAAARLLEVLGIEDRSSEEVFADFPEDLSTPEINISVTDESKFMIVESLCALKDQFVGGNISTIDGLRVEYPNAWGLCRASNTTPVLVLRFEADNEAALEEVKSIFRTQLQIVDPSIECNF